MLGLGPLAFAQPWLLAALVALPALWWLLRLVPPPPREVAFPPVRFLMMLTRRETTARRTPWWLLLLRLAAVAALILAAAQPIVNPAPQLAGGGPLVLVVDDGWPSARHWEAMRARGLAEIAQAERERREVVLVTTAPVIAPEPAAPIGAGAAREAMAALAPVPWWPDRAAAAERLAVLDLARASVVWLTDGVARDDAGRAAADRLAAELDRLGPVRVMAPPPPARASLLAPAGDAGGAVALGLMRPAAGVAATVEIRALGADGEVLGVEQANFDAAERAAEVRFELPPPVLERARRFERVPARSTGDVVLTDRGLGARSVGIVASGGGLEAQPLVSERFFVERALAGRARVTTGGVGELAAVEPAAIVLLDDQELSVEQEERLKTWIEAGGVLLRFAGPNLAERASDPLVPVELRHGGRRLDGALSWAEPLALGRFIADGPLAGVPVSPDVRVRRQVLAEPAAALDDRTLAVLADGTPLVTGERRGEGWLMLVHTTANTRWSDLALSGTFVALLERAADLGRGRQPPPGDAVLRPVRVLDAFGRLGEPGASITPVPAQRLLDGEVGPATPPGIWADEAAGAERAFNLARADARVTALRPSDLNHAPRPFEGAGETDLRPWFLLAALALLLLDLLAVGLLRGRGRRAAPAAAALALGLLAAPAGAQSFDPVALAADTPLGFVRSGDAELDRLTRAGLEGLATTLWRRTSVEASDPVAVDIAADPLALFPIIFWPVPAEVEPLPPATGERLLGYLESGGMVVFDTRDAHLAVPGSGRGTPGMRRLQRLLEAVEMPALERVGPDHVLTRSFYLLQDFPGRYTGQPIWVDRPQPGVNDGVSSIVIAANDWLGAWAIDEADRPLLPVTPGGERQRELARRVGVNLVMYALTGNYKTDQVHVPTLLERLGQ